MDSIPIAAPSYYPCPYCGATFTTMAALTSHIEEMQGIGPHPPAPPVYYCLYCDATFSSQAALDAHIASAHPPPVYPCPYPYCGATFSSQAALEAHIASAHPPPVFPCPECDAEFSTAAALFRHMDVAHPPLPTTFHLSVSVPSGGSISPGSGDYLAYSTVTLRAYPSSGYQFVRWGGDASGTSTTYNLYMNSNKSVTAYFEKVPVPVDGHISRKQLEYDEARASIPVYDIPEGQRGLVHIWGRNDTTESQRMGIYWFVADPDGMIAEEYGPAWEAWPYTGAGQEHEFIGGRFNLDREKYTMWVELLMNKDDPEVVDRYIGDLCTVAVLEYKGTISKKELEYDGTRGAIPVY